MTTFDDRKKAFEKKFAHDAEMAFKAAARRNKLLGHWLAPKLAVEDAETYARSVVVADLEESGDEDVMRKVMADVRAAKVDLDEAEIRAKLAEFSIEAMAQIMAEAD